MMSPTQESNPHFLHLLQWQADSLPPGKLWSIDKCVLNILPGLSTAAGNEKDMVPVQRVLIGEKPATNAREHIFLKSE